jgi:hypothetical protein
MKCLSVCGLWLGVVLLLSQSVLLGAEEAVQWGDAVDGLRLSLDVDDNAHELLFSIQNVSEHTELVDVGDNGIPVRITVGLTTKGGKVRDGELGMSSAMHASGAGIYENIIEILPKSTYVIPHSMGDFTPIATVEPRVFPLMTVKSGDMITGHLRGKGPKCSTSDSRRYEICWASYLISNTVQLK